MATTHPQSTTAPHRQRAARTQPEVRRAQLIEEGSQLIARHGFTNVTVEQIAGSIGLVKAGFYHHFATKQELLAAIVVETHEAGVRILDHLEDGEGSARGRIERYVREHARWVVTHSDRVEIIRRETARLPDDRAADDAAFRRRFSDVLSREIALAQAEGDFDNTMDPHLAAHEVLGMLNWLAQWHLPDQALGDEAVVEQVTRQAIAGMTANTPGRST